MSFLYWLYSTLIVCMSTNQGTVVVSPVPNGSQHFQCSLDISLKKVLWRNQLCPIWNHIQVWLFKKQVHFLNEKYFSYRWMLSHWVRETLQNACESLKNVFHVKVLPTLLLSLLFKSLQPTFHALIWRTLKNEIKEFVSIW